MTKVIPQISTLPWNLIYIHLYLNPSWLFFLQFLERWTAHPWSTFSLLHLLMLKNTQEHVQTQEINSLCEHYTATDKLLLIPKQNFGKRLQPLILTTNLFLYKTTQIIMSANATQKKYMSKETTSNKVNNYHLFSGPSSVSLAWMVTVQRKGTEVETETGVFQWPHLVLLKLDKSHQSLHHENINKIN